MKIVGFSQDRSAGPGTTERVVDVEAGITFAALSGAGAGAAHHDMFELALNKALQGICYWRARFFVKGVYFA